jgi:hypothetical protein
MTDDSVSHYFEFYRVNLNGEKKALNGSLVPIYNAACMPLFYGIKKILFILIYLFKVICEKYRLRGEANFSCPLNRYFLQITLTNRIYLFNSAEYLTVRKTVACKPLLSTGIFRK